YGVPWIYTDATTSGGSSGGTAVNGQGLFVGIPTIATISDCRPGDTNNDGLEDEHDQGCIGIGGNVLTGEMVTIYADITFTEMTDGSIWQAEWYLDGELVFASDPEVWDQEASGTETARLRNPDRGPLEAGAYELVITLDGVESDRTTVVIEG
ncbi:MAG: hypothetical protein M3457_10635, partial [Chloroflexota bacterium]|nr:hypothetical protein [Chloroflexota bacterium]